ncbi:MAG: coniferyl aldehyde dehydrogenase [Halomonadaceae bacterium]|nr:MAG: coniferyl aldehyde dehydrogenase [Halomonadaceae bacterium]
MANNVVRLNTGRTTQQLHARILTQQRQAFRRNPWPNLNERLDHLQRLKRALLSNQDSLTEAIDRDFGCRSPDETRLAELMPCLQNIRYTMAHLAQWLRPDSRHVALRYLPASNRVVYQPLGVVGIIVPWNYPLLLAIGPLVAALAAGNRVMLKVSEFTPHTAVLLKSILENTFSRDQVAIINGDESVAADFAAQPFDHLLFTGSTAVGRKVMKAAAQNLTPVTLELGGKSPAIIGNNAPMKDAAERIIFGKSLNAGQTCVSPDYLLCPADRIPAFIEAARDCFNRLYPSLQDNPDYTAIINTRHYRRLQGLLDDALAKGARVTCLNPAQELLPCRGRKIPLSLVTHLSGDMRLLHEEIFGPILPIIPHCGLQNAMDYINAQPTPLALYYLGYDRAEQEQVIAGTRSGSVGINDTLMQVLQDDLPFGGMGESGMGHYHGHEGFLTFSTCRGVHSRQRINNNRVMYPPYGSLLQKVVYQMFLR